MRLWRLSAGAMLGAAALLLAGCGLLSPSESYRYRMTIEVETPAGLRTGSSIIEVTTGKGPAFPGPEAATLHTRIRGEAAAVDLPDGQTLFALLRNSTSSQAAASHALSAFAEREPGLRYMSWREQIGALKRMRGQAELPRSAYPTLVRFTNISDPGTVEQVDPNNLATVFGPGVHITRITVALTEDGLTEKMKAHLPWLESIGRQRGTLIPDPPRLLRDTTLIQQVSSSDFSTELWK